MRRGIPFAVILDRDARAAQGLPYRVGGDNHLSNMREVPSRKRTPPMKWNEYTFTVTDLATGDVIAPKWKACSEGESPIHLARTIYDER